MPKCNVPPLKNLCEDVRKLCDVINKESDLAAVLVCSSFIDACLALLLQHHFKKSSISDKILDSRSGILGTFQSRTDVAYCLGLLTKKRYQDLVFIGEIRNKFAHFHLQLDFQNAEIIQLCKSIKYFDFAVKDETGKAIPDEKKLDFLKHAENPRYRFTMTVLMISNEILLAVLAKAKGGTT